MVQEIKCACNLMHIFYVVGIVISPPLDNA